MDKFSPYYNHFSVLQLKPADQTRSVCDWKELSWTMLPDARTTPADNWPEPDGFSLVFLALLWLNYLKAAPLALAFGKDERLCLLRKTF